ncbi:MAG: DNA-binding protein [Alphaproteobacteria bacterium]|nr:DNA-binding protein [Alphaproteobacteria bacterium]
MLGKLLSRKEASEYLLQKGISRTVSSLNKLATIGGGPKFHKFGNTRVYYLDNELDEWVELMLSKALSSTAELL